MSLGKFTGQGEFWRPEHELREHVGEDSFHAWLRDNATKYFPDREFADFYVRDNGRNSIPPSQMMVLVLLKTFHNVSDQETIDRSRYDVRWKLALGIGYDEGLCAKSTLWTFRQRLLSNEGKGLLERSIQACRDAGVFKRRKIRAAIDTTPIFGRGAVKDTYNLLADALVLLLKTVAAFESSLFDSTSPEFYADQLGLLDYLTASSFKGMAAIDWDDRKQRQQLLDRLVGDCDRLLAHTEAVLADAEENDMVRLATREDVEDSMRLLRRILEQDVVRTDAGAELKQGVEKDRIVSAHDPDMRHSRKSSSVRFDGHKGQIVVDTESKVILDATVKPGNSYDGEGTLEAIERAEEALQKLPAQQNDADDGRATDQQQKTAAERGDEQAGKDEQLPKSEPEIEMTLGDCAYGSAENRRAFADAGRVFEAKQAQLQSNGRFTKDDFTVQEDGSRTCPAGHCVKPKKTTRQWRKESVKVNQYTWPYEVCCACSKRDQCMKPKKMKQTSPKRGRMITEHPEEALLKRARERQREEEFRQIYVLRQAVEHRLARMIQLGGRQARYFGLSKTGLQWRLLAVVANLTLAVAASGRQIARFLLSWPLWRLRGPRVIEVALSAS
jgi:transposase